MGKFEIERLNSILTITFCILSLGCAQNASEDTWPTIESPTIIDEVHHQDLINLSDLSLPQPVDINLIPQLDTPVFTLEPKETNPIKPKESDKKAETEKSQAKEGRGSVYYIPIFSQVRKCDEKLHVHLRDLSGKVLALLCKNEITDCAMQGSCYFSDGKDIKVFSYRKLVEIKDPKTGKKFSEPRFVINHEHSRCPQGMGFRRICLDPYRSVAADMKFHKAGDVFFIPILRGQILPNGESHDGYVVVRDIGGAILGEGRFDFFIGFDNYVGHLFSKLNLSNPHRSTFTYYKVSEERAEQVRRLRAFPLVPGRVHDQALSSLTRQPRVAQVKNSGSQIDITSGF
ncbi:MAG: 3D domain-containing protein [Bdellovibrionales bacterium]